MSKIIENYRERTVTQIQKEGGKNGEKILCGEENDPFTIALVCTDKISSDKEHD